MMHKIPSRFTVQTKFDAIVINKITNHLTLLCFMTKVCAEVRVLIHDNEHCTFSTCRMISKYWLSRLRHIVSEIPLFSPRAVV